MTPPTYSTPNRTPVTIEPRSPLPHEADSVLIRDVTDEPGTFYREGVHPVYLALAGVVGCLLGLVALTVFAWGLL